MIALCQRETDATWTRVAFLIAMLVILVLSPGCGDNASLTETSSATITSAPASSVNSPPSAVNTQLLYTFAVCGDNRAIGIESGVLPGIIESAKARGAAFMVNTGDVSGDGSREELALYRDLMESSGLKFHTVPGNHDIGSGGVSQDYEEIIGPYYYGFDYAGDHFIILDNADDRTGIDDSQMEWLRAELAANSGKPHQFIFVHIPIADPSLPSGHVSGEKGGEGLRTGQQLVAEAAAYDNMDAFFFGHIHAYLAYKLDDIDAYVTGGAGAPLYFPEDAGGYYHYLLVSVYQDEVRVEVIRV